MNAAILLSRVPGLFERIRMANVTVACSRFDPSPHEHIIRFSFPGDTDSTYVKISLDETLINEYEPGEVPDGVREFILVEYHTANAFRQFVIDCLSQVDCIVDDDRCEQFWDSRDLRTKMMADMRWDWRDGYPNSTPRS